MKYSGLGEKPYPQVKRDDRKELFLRGLLGDKSARDTAIASLVPLGISIAQFYDNGKERIDDAVQSAMLQVVKKFDTYDPLRRNAAGYTANPSTYFEKVMRNSILTFYGERKFVPLPPVVPAAVDTCSVDRQEVSDLVHEALDRLPEKKRELIRRRFGIDCEPESVYAIAESKGCSAQNIDQLTRPGIDALRRILALPKFGLVEETWDPLAQGRCYRQTTRKAKTGS